MSLNCNRKMSNTLYKYFSRMLGTNIMLQNHNILMLAPCVQERFRRKKIIIAVTRDDSGSKSYRINIDLECSFQTTSVCSNYIIKQTRRLLEHAITSNVCLLKFMLVRKIVPHTYI